MKIWKSIIIVIMFSSIPFVSAEEQLSANQLDILGIGQFNSEPERKEKYEKKLKSKSSFSHGSAKIIGYQAIKPTALIRYLRRLESTRMKKGLNIKSQISTFPDDATLVLKLSENESLRIMTDTVYVSKMEDKEYLLYRGHTEGEPFSNASLVLNEKGFSGMISYYKFGRTLVISTIDTGVIVYTDHPADHSYSE